MAQTEIHVLLVEDNAFDARFVKEMLRDDEMGGFTIQHVTSLLEAQSILSRDTENQIILLDLGLPDETGLQTLRRIVPLARGASIVLLTSQHDEELGIAALREGAHDYLVKGQIEGRQLRRVLRYAVERQKLLTELRAEIEARTQAQQALQISEQRYRQLSETAPMGIIIADGAGRIVDTNAHALRMFGYSREELLGQTIEILLPERLRKSHERHRSTYIQGPQSRPMGIGMELVARRKDGTEFPVEIALGPVATQEGTLISSTILDIRERKTLEKQLQLSQRMEAIGQLAGGVAHDFNNLMTVILGCCEALADELSGNRAALRKVEMIKKAGDSAADLTRQLLAFGRKQILQPKVIEPGEILKGVEGMLRRLIGENIRLEVNVHSEAGCVSADPGQMEQILVNLAANARDAMPNGGLLTIEVANADLDDAYVKLHPPAVPGPYVMFAVSDTGCGMDQKTQSQIFDPFFTTKEFGKGTGLGLATVYGIVKQSRGYIWVYSELGKGSAFKIYLPRIGAAATPVQQVAADGAAERGSETILLAEDTDALREIAREYLGNLGYTVIEADSGEQALQRVHEFGGEIHLLLTDVVMSGMSGRELADRIVQKYPSIKILFTSGYTDDSVARQGIFDLSVAFIQKPYRPKALARKIREILSAPASDAENAEVSSTRPSGDAT
jgi:hypothetical protein